MNDLHYMDISLAWGCFSWFVRDKAPKNANLYTTASSDVTDNNVFLTLLTRILRNVYSFFYTTGTLCIKQGPLGDLFSQFVVREHDWPAQFPDLNPNKHLRD